MRILLKIILVEIFFITTLFAQISKTVEDYGAKGDGVTDDAGAIQVALDALKRYGGEIKFTSGKTYIIGRGLSMNYFAKNKHYLVTTTGKEKATIKIKNGTPISYGYWGLFLVASQNITIKNLRLDGNRDTRNPIEEKADVYLLEIRNKCDGLRLYDLELVNSVMDNIYVSVSGDESDTTKWTTDFEMYNCILKNGYRNNMSIIRGMNFKIIGCEFNNANGHDPESGIDFEPNRVGSTVGYKNVLVDGCIFKNNKRYGIMFTHKRTNSGYCIVRNCYFENNGLQFASHNNIAEKNIFRKQTRPSDYGGPVDGIINFIDGDASYNIVRNNFFYDNNQPSTPSRNLIALLRGANGNNEIHHNYSFNNSTRGIVYNYSSSQQNIYDNSKLKRRECGYWNFDSDSVSGTSVFDLSDFKQTGKIYGTPGLVTGIVNEAFDFSGGNKYVEIPVKENLNIEKNITLSAWVKPKGDAADTSQVIIGRDNDWKLAINKTGQPVFCVANNEGKLIPMLTSKTSLSPDKWSLVTFTYNGREAKIYLDTLEQSAVNYYEKLATESAKIYIASANGLTDFFNGDIDEVKIYNYAFSEEEIRTLFKISTSVKLKNNMLPEKYILEQNYPNPFNPNTTIEFAVPKQTKVNLTVYNMLGEKIIELKNDNFNAGYYKINFDASNLSSGIYFCRMKTGDFISTKKMLLLK